MQIWHTSSSPWCPHSISVSLAGNLRQTSPRHVSITFIWAKMDYQLSFVNLILICCYFPVHMMLHSSTSLRLCISDSPVPPSSLVFLSPHLIKRSDLWSCSSMPLLSFHSIAQCVVPQKRQRSCYNINQ